MKNILIVVLGVFVLPLSTSAQTENWNDFNYKTSIESLMDSVSYFYNRDDKAQTAKYLDRLMAQTKNLPDQFYQIGIDVYKKMSLEAASPAEKNAFADAMLNLYSKNAQFYGDSVSTANRKAFDCFMCAKDLPDLRTKVFKLYDHLFSNNTSRLESYNALPYVFLAKTQFRSGEISENNYWEIIEMIRKEIEVRPKNAAWIKIDENLDKFL